MLYLNELFAYMAADGKREKRQSKPLPSGAEIADVPAPEPEVM